MAGPIVWPPQLVPQFETPRQATQKQLPDGRPLLATISIIKVAVIIPIMLLFHWLMRNTSVLKVAHQLSWVTVGFVWAILVLFIFFARESGSSFIYFQF